MRHARAWLLVAVALAYVQAPAGPLQFDDYATIAVDPGMRSLAAWWAGVMAHVRPLTKLTFVITHALGEHVGKVALVHHLGSIMIHAFAVLALYSTLRTLHRTCTPGLEPAAVERAAFAAALIFAVHPLATEAVTYLSGRSMALGSLFAFLAFGAWMRGRRAIAIVGLVAAVLCRETMLAALLLLPLWEWARLDRPSPAFTLQRLGGVSAAAAAIAGVTLLASAWLLSSDRYGALLESAARIAADRAAAPTLLIALRHFVESLLLFRYPSIDPDVALTLTWPTRMVLMALLGLVTYAAWRRRHAQPEWLLGLTWVLVFIAPVYLLHMRHDLIAERHFYPALAGAALVAGMASARLRRTGPALLGSVVALLVIVTLTRNADYRSEVALWEAAARSAPDRGRVLNNLGVAYMETGRWDDAEAVLSRAVELDPGHARAADNLRQARERRLATENRNGARSSGR